MATLEERLANGVKAGKIPHAVVAATNRDGRQTKPSSTIPTRSH